MGDDSTKIIIELQGNPIPLKRPRLGKTKVFDPQKREKLAAYWDIRAQYRGPILDEPIVVSMEFVFEPPTSWSKKRSLECLGTAKCTKPDIDNCVKWVLDVLQDAVIADDNIVHEIHAKKIWGSLAKTVIRIRRGSEDPQS